MAKITQLTEDQEFLLVETRDKWIQHALYESDEIDHQKAEAGIAWMYEITGMKAPKVIYVDSPLAVQYACNILIIEGASKNNTSGQVYDQVRGQVYDQVRGQVSDQVRGQVSDQVRGQVRDQVRGQVSDQVYGQVYGQVSGQVRGQVSDQVRGQVYDQVRGQVRGQVYDQVYEDKLTWFYWSYENLAWRSGEFAYFDFFYQIGVTQHEGLKKYLDYLESGVFMSVFLQDYAVVCRRPSAIRCNEEHLLSYDHDAAIEWRDGYKLWYLDGVNFEYEEWKKIVNEEFTLGSLAKAAMGSDKSAVAMKYLRPDRLLKGMKAKLVHTGRKGTKLYKVDNFTHMVDPGQPASGDTEYCIVMKHPSLDRIYLEWVEPELGAKGDADACQAAAFGVPLEDYLNAIEA